MRAAVIVFLLPMCVAQLDSAPPAELDQWIQALGAREFGVRDRATQALIAAGPIAIEPALKVVERGDHEVATRAVMVLKGIGEQGDIETLEAVLAALSRVMLSTTLPVGRRAAEVQVRLESVRQDRAIQFFRSLGAEINPELNDTWTSLYLTAPVFAIELGPNWKGMEKDLERLKWLRDVQQVSLVGPKVSDSWLRHVHAMPGVISVKIKHADISLAAIEELATFERLRVLRLMFVPLGDEMVTHLEKCDTLFRLLVISPKLTEQGEKRLKNRFNDLVECSQGAMLGVRAGLEEPWSIREVVPGSAAERAGLRPQDRIIKWNGHEINTFPELKELISKCRPGESASVEVERGTQILPLKIICGEWD